MADIDEPQQPRGTTDLSVIPESYSIPAQLIEQWMKIDQNEYVSFALTRSDIDKIFAAFYKLSISSEALQQCIIHWSNGRTEVANSEMLKSQKLSVEAVNDARHAMAAIMISTVSKAAT